MSIFFQITIFFTILFLVCLSISFFIDKLIRYLVLFFTFKSKFERKQRKIIFDNNLTSNEKADRLIELHISQEIKEKKDLRRKKLKTIFKYYNYENKKWICK